MYKASHLCGTGGETSRLILVSRGDRIRTCMEPWGLESTGMVSGGFQSRCVYQFHHARIVSYDYFNDTPAPVSGEVRELASPPPDTHARAGDPPTLSRCAGCRLCLAIDSGGPIATTQPPPSPPSGPRSISQSGIGHHVGCARSTTTVFPASTERCSTRDQPRRPCQSNGGLHRGIERAPGERHEARGEASFVPFSPGKPPSGRTFASSVTSLMRCASPPGVGLLAG